MKNDWKEYCVNNAIAYWNLLANKAGGLVINETFMTAAIMGVNSGIFNSIFRFHVPDYEKIKLQIASNLTQKATLPVCFWLDENIPDSDKNVFSSLKLPVFGSIPILMLETSTRFAAPLPGGIKIVKYNTPDLTEWMKPFSTSFGIDVSTSSILKSILETNHDKVIHFAAIQGENVIACASIFIQEEFAGFYNLGTLPEHRNRGIGTALHLARLKYANKLGFKYATLQATPMATKLDCKLGFKKVGGFTIFMDNIPILETT